MSNFNFRQVYETYLNTEQAFREMDVDIDDATCGAPKCILTNAQSKLADSLVELKKTDIDLCELDIDELLNKINECFNDCISFDIVTPDKPDTDLPSVESRDFCPVGGILMSLDDIRRFRIYEYANNRIEVYVVPKADLPMVVEIPNTARKYTVSWDATYNMLRLRYTHKYGASLTAPAGGFTVASVVAELATSTAVTFGAEVRACSAFNFTEGTQWGGGGLSEMIDNNDNSYPVLLNSELNEVIIGYQFKTTL